MSFTECHLQHCTWFESSLWPCDWASTAHCVGQQAPKLILNTDKYSCDFDTYCKNSDTHGSQTNNLLIHSSYINVLISLAGKWAINIMAVKRGLNIITAFWRSTAWGFLLIYYLLFNQVKENEIKMSFSRSTSHIMKDLKDVRQKM